MPIPAGHKNILKGRLEIPRGRYTLKREHMEMKEMTYGQRGKSHTSDEADLFDMFCKKCQGDHLSMFCPVGRTIRDRRRDTLESQDLK